MESKKPTDTLRIGYIGLGDMGQAMALNLADRGWTMSVYDKRAARAEPFTTSNVTRANELSEAAAASNVLCLCVVDAQQCEDVLFGPGGAVSALHEGDIVVIHSTIGPVRCREIGEKLKKSRIHCIDAPVSGAAVRARAGDLTIPVGGDSEIVARCLPVLKDEASTVVHVGGVGSGQIAKLLNNGLFAVQVSFIDEVVRLGEAMGLDANQLWNIIDSGATGSWSSGYYGRQVALAGGKRDPASVFGRAPDPDSSLRIITKDVALCLQQLEDAGLGHTRMAQVASRAIDSLGEKVTPQPKA